uniref:Uncharacterized protein n=2 Tax=Cucumis melo TaxID=3656 RepID=A0A9I9DNY5_CUCME
MEKELLDIRFDTPKGNKTNTELPEERASHNMRIMTIPKKMIKIFLRLPTKHATKKPDKQSSPNMPINSMSRS